ncbi:MAG: type VI secretion system baseplate subunit TssF [Planctomycetales bacterium]|nr:type VI secretion system baseplate subunit TssF [Planctomycetales bacterium]
MTDELLSYYNRELAFIRNMGAEFAAAHPKIAGRLRMSGEISEDPHVSRMIEAFAFLAARTRHKIDDDFPEICESMLSVLYPHFLAPQPSAAIVQCSLHPSQAELTSGHRIKRGSSIETDAVDGMPCRFQTCYDVDLLPIQVASAQLQSKPFSAPLATVSNQAEAVLRIQLQSLSPKVTFAQLPLDCVRFFLNGQGQFAYDLYELILNNSLGIAVGSTDNACYLPASCLRPVGFERDQGLVNYGAQSFLGYRLLSEYFAFPEKYLFVDLTGLRQSVSADVLKSNKLEIFVYVNQRNADLERTVSADAFRLGCTPMVNLYKQRAEPIRWTHTETEYRIVPDSRRPAAHEIYSIDRIIGTSPGGKEIEFSPFYSTQHLQPEQGAQAFWHATRRRAGRIAGQVDHGTEMFLSLVDLDFQPSAVRDWTIDVETTCVNRDLPRRIPFGGGQPRLQLTTGSGLVGLRCLTPPTATLRPSLRHQSIWKLVSHLSLNHLSLISDKNGAQALREILMLYDPLNTTESKNIINGVEHIAAKRIVGRVSGGAAAGFCRGIEIDLTLNEEKFIGSGIYLFASVLERFFGLYASLNSFTSTVVHSQQRPGRLCKWPPRAGERVLI